MGSGNWKISNIRKLAHWKGTFIFKREVITLNKETEERLKSLEKRVAVLEDKMQVQPSEKMINNIPRIDERVAIRG